MRTRAHASTAIRKENRMNTATNETRTGTKTIAMIALFAIGLILARMFALPSQAFADEIEAGKWYSVTLGPNDTATSTYTVPDKGYFYLETKGIYDSHSDDCTYSTVTLAHDYVDYYKGTYIKIGVIDSSRCVSLRKGARVTITFKNNCISSNTTDYRIVQVKPKLAETEPNDLKAKANPLKRNKTLTGVLNDAEDVDWFSFKAPKTSRYKIQLRVIDTYSWIYDARYNNKTIVSSRLGWKTCATAKMRKSAIKKFRIVPNAAFSGPNGTVYEVRVVKA